MVNGVYYSQDFDDFRANATELLGVKQLEEDVWNVERWGRLEVTNLTTQLATMPNMAYLYEYPGSTAKEGTLC